MRLSKLLNQHSINYNDHIFSFLKKDFILDLQSEHDTTPINIIKNEQESYYIRSDKLIAFFKKTQTTGFIQLSELLNSPDISQISQPISPLVRIFNFLSMKKKEIFFSHDSVHAIFNDKNEIVGFFFKRLKVDLNDHLEFNDKIIENLLKILEINIKARKKEVHSKEKDLNQILNLYKKDLDLTLLFKITELF